MQRDSNTAGPFVDHFGDLGWLEAAGPQLNHFLFRFREPVKQPGKSSEEIVDLKLAGRIRRTGINLCRSFFAKLRAFLDGLELVEYSVATNGVQPGSQLVLDLVRTLLAQL